MKSLTSPNEFQRSWSYLLSLFILCGVVDALAPRIVPMKQLDDLEMGQRVTILCAIKEGSVPISFAWRKDGVPIVQSSDLKVVHIDESQETLQIVTVTPRHVGNYTCSVKNSFGSDQTSVSVHPKYEPRWTNPNSTVVSGVLGETLTIDCSAHGQPKPTVKVFRGRPNQLAPVSARPCSEFFEKRMFFLVLSFVRATSFRPG